MFKSWYLTDNSGLDTGTLSNSIIEKLDGLQLKPKAQQKLINAISTNQEVLKLKEQDYIQVTPEWCTSTEQAFTMLLPELSVKLKNNSCDIELTKWISSRLQEKDDSKIRHLKKIVTKELIFLSTNCKSLMEKSLLTSKETETYFEKTKNSKDSNKWIINFPYNLIFECYQPKALEYIKWVVDSKLNIENAIWEETPSIELNHLLFSNIEPSFIPKIFFASDYYEKEMFIPIISNAIKNPEMLISHAKISKWVFNRRLNWEICSDIIESITGENVKKLEMKFKVRVQGITVPSFCEQCKTRFISHTKNNNWTFSQYKKYMMNWKPFGGLRLNDALEENDSMVAYCVPLLNDTDDVKYIKLLDMVSNSKNKYKLNYKLMPLITHSNDQSDKFFQDNEVQEALPIQLQEGTSIVIDSNIGLSNGDGYLKGQEEIKETTLSPKILIENQHQQGSSITLPKRELSEIESIILRKKKRSNPVQFDFNKEYPYLDILNQSITIPTTQGKSELPETKDSASKDLMSPLEHTDITTDANNENILDASDTDLNSSLLNIPESKVCNIALDINLANRFGAAYLQFSKLLENEHSLYVNEINLDSEQLNYDMFLNETCGVIFLRPINIYQVDIKTGENLVFQQLSQIAHQVSSLIIVIIVDETVDFETDEKLKSFFKMSEESGIQIYIVSSDAKIIAVSMFELVQKYGVLEDEKFQWTPENKFLEACGISNPFLIWWISKNCNMDDFLTMDEEDRTKYLLRMCTNDLVTDINQAVQEFKEGKF